MGSFYKHPWLNDSGFTLLSFFSQVTLTSTHTALSEVCLRWHTRTKLLLICCRCRFGVSGAVIAIITIVI